MYSNVAIVVPAYNEGTILHDTVERISREFTNIFVVDDGSSDNSADSLFELNCKVIRHITNLGQGAAIQTGVVYALQNTDCDYFLTFDADGQHDLDSAKKIISEIEKLECDIVIGSRFLEISAKNMPRIKRLLLKLAVVYTRLETGLKLTDTHNGMRVFNRNFANELKISQHGMAHASEILGLIAKNNFRWKEMPVEILYTDHSLKKGQSTLNAVNILTERLFK